MSAQLVEIIAWSAHLLLADLGQLAAANRLCWGTLRHDLHSIWREITDEREEQLLAIWRRADNSAEVSDSD